MSDDLAAYDYTRSFKIVHAATTTATGLTKRELDAPACRACYRPIQRAGYCASCEGSGAAERHRSGR